MISDSTKKGVDLIFTKAAVANLVASQGDSCIVEALPNNGKVVDTGEKQLFVLTISSYVFRLLTIFHVNPDRRTQDYFTKAGNAGEFNQVVGELGNLCCGAMNRELGNYFPHLGMSTPYTLEAKCLPYIKELKPGYTSQHKLTINDSIGLHATLCLCAYAPIDFRVDTSMAQEETGALELF